MRLVVFPINADFLTNQLKNIFTQNTWHCSFIATKNFLCLYSEVFTLETLYPSFIWKILSKYISPFFPKAIGALWHGGFYKHPRFTICFLVLSGGEVHSISNNRGRNFFLEKKEIYKGFFVKLLLFCWLFRWLLFIWNIAHFIRREN